MHEDHDVAYALLRDLEQTLTGARHRLADLALLAAGGLPPATQGASPAPDERPEGVEPPQAEADRVIVLPDAQPQQAEADRVIVLPDAQPQQAEADRVIVLPDAQSPERVSGR